MDNKVEHSTSHSLASQVVKIYTAVEASSEAVFVTNIKGHIEYANHKFLELNDLNEAEALGSSISKIPHSGKIALQLLGALKNGQSWSKRHQVKSSLIKGENNSGLIWVRTSIDPFMEEPGKVSGYIGIQRVIQQEVERELQTRKELAEVLAMAIKQDKMIAELKISHSESLQEAAGKSAFVADMSHEIRTPLNGVLGMAELLQKTTLSRKQSHLTTIIQQSGKTLLHLINNILDLSKFEAGKLELNNASHDIRLILEEVANTFSERANSKGLELTCIYPANDHSLFICDRQRLIQVLNNLISNAIKFTDEGEVVIEVNISDREDDKSLRFEVRDTGAGIPEKDQSLIFESFSQSQQTLEKSSEGTGLGLTICKHIVELMDGEIGVRSIPDEGSTFWFTAQLEKDENTNIRMPVNKEHLLAGLKVLIVDDNTSNSENISLQLKNWLIQSSTVSNVVDAIKILEEAKGKKQPFSQVIFDHDMSDICGENLGKIVRKNKILTKTPLILMNSINSFEDTMVWTSAGITSYITKPVRQTELYNALLATISLPEREPGDNENNSSPENKIFNANILIVEDNPVNQELARLMLEERGCTAEIAANGKIALELLGENNDKTFELILMDCQMPVMDGYETTRAIRDQFESLELPIVALTANAMEEDRQRCLDAGMNDYLGKPFSGDQLSEVLEKWLSEKPPEESLEQILEEVEIIDNPIIEEVPEREQEFSIEPEIDDILEDDQIREEEEAPAGELNQTTLDNIRALQREGAPDILEKIVGLYLDNSNTIMTDLELAVEKKDRKKIRSAAHSLKSSSANLGADNLAALCKEVEMLGKNDQLESVDDKLIILKQSYDQACKALQSEIT